jgi:predicted enzyme related to lactoylglutathione lyase
MIQSARGGSGRICSASSWPSAARPRAAAGRHTMDPAVGIHERGTGPGDTVSLPYFTIADMDAALGQVRALGGSVIHSGSRWAICRDSEGSPFGLALDSAPS